MSRRPLAALVLAAATAAVVAVGGTGALPAGAQGTTTTVPTTSTTEAPDPGGPTTSTTTTTTSTSTTTVPGAPVPPTLPAGPATTLPEPVDVDDMVRDPAPPGPWDTAPRGNEQLARLFASLSDAQARAAAAEGALTAARLELEAAQGDVERLSPRLQHAAERLAEVRRRFRERVAVAYVVADRPRTPLPSPRGVRDAADRVVLPGAVTESDRRLADTYRRLQHSLDRQVRDAVERRDRAQADLELAEANAARDSGLLTDVQGRVMRIDAAPTGFWFPIVGETSFISSFGFCRDGCTRRHQGNDLFAATGSPVVAVEDGWVERVGTNRLGGLIVWTRGISGYRYYYAHLSVQAPLVAGAPITAGELVGLVGNTGNALTTPPHLHFEIHPGQGAAIDPYPVLARAPRVAVPRLAGSPLIAVGDPSAPSTTAPASPPATA